MVHLTDDQQRVLDGRNGKGAELAMRFIVKAAEAFDAERLVPITSSHITSCFYNGQPSIDFARRLVELGAKVSVPTTLNSTAPAACLTRAGRDDLLPLRFRKPAAVAVDGKELMDLYVALGGQPTFTCAPYHLPSAPKHGQHVAWAESSAVIYVNSVIGARTNKYGEFIDICAAISGHAPETGLHRDENRLPTHQFSVAGLPTDFLQTDLSFHLLGYVIGSRLQDDVPYIIGLPLNSTKDQLRAFGATAAVVSSVSLFHVAGVTPEADGAATHARSLPLDCVIDISLDDVRKARDTLSSGRGALTMVCLGTPHCSLDEFGRIAALLDGRRVNGNVRMIITTSRYVREQAAERGFLDICQRARCEIIVDTCSYISSMLDGSPGIAMTNSCKWAYRAPVTVGVSVALGTLEECVRSAVAGQVISHDIFKVH